MRGILGGVEVHVPKNHLEEPAVIDESRHEPFLVVRSECGALPYELEAAPFALHEAHPLEQVGYHGVSSNALDGSKVGIFV